MTPGRNLSTRNIEDWALRVLRAHKAGGVVEDGRVEIKQELATDPSKAARQIAAHLNAVSGESVLWLIGPEDKGTDIRELPRVELSSWWGQVRSKFYGAPPTIEDHVVDFEGRRPLAMLFVAAESPCMIGNRERAEIPFREATSTRSATPSEVRSMVLGRARLPVVELLGVHVDQLKGMDELPSWHVTARIYLEPVGGDPVFMPYHKSRAYLGFGRAAAPERLVIRPGGGRDLSYVDETVIASGSQVHATGPGAAMLECSGSVGGRAVEPESFTLVLQPVGCPHPVQLQAMLRAIEQPPGTRRSWGFGKPWGA